MQHSSRKHAVYGASSAYRWMKCLGSTRLVRTAPPQESGPDAKEGTAAHEILDYCLTNNQWYAVDGWILTGCPTTHFRNEMTGHIDAVQTALDYIKGILEQHDDAVLYVEASFKFPTSAMVPVLDIDGNVMDTLPADAWGTCDCAIFIPSLNLLYIIDYKHGAGNIVDVEENPQLLFYATGFVFKEDVRPLIDDGTIIQCVIIQPRAIHKNGTVRPWSTNLARLETFIVEVDDAITASCEPNAPLKAGEKQCKWCPARLICPAAEAATAQVVKSNFRTVKEVIREGLPSATTLPLDRIVTILDAKALIMDYFKEVEDVAYKYMIGGGAIPGKKIVEAQARRKWWDADNSDMNTANALMRLANVTDIDKVYPRCLIGIGEAEKLVTAEYKRIAPRGQKKQAAQLANEALAALTLKESSGNLVMVDASDARPEYKRAAVNFANVNVPALPSPAQL